VRVLAVDTTSAQGSLALLEDGEVIDEVSVVADDGYAQLLFPAIEDLLRRHGWTLSLVDLFATASGPGSFTGVRVGVTAVKGLAEALGRPAQAVSTLRAIAALGTADLRMPLINARRGETYAGLYDGGLRSVAAECNGQLSQILANRPAGAELICQEPWAELTAAGVEFYADRRPLAAMVARIAVQDGGVDPVALDANYVRRSDADGRWHDV
jgi:tRNA threonylcarbamoyladenosine biosynthesis protein TsaB